MSLQDRLTAIACSTLREHMRSSRKVRLQPMPYTKPVLPPPPMPIEQSDVWPACFHESIETALRNAWSDGTIRNYASAIRMFLAFCASHDIPPAQMFPASDYLITAFIASQKASLSSSTIRNYLSGIRAWHISNGFAFSHSDRLNLISKASRPLANKLPPRPPVSLEMLQALCSSLKVEDLFDCCVLACATTAFWGLAQLGELLPSSDQYDHDLPPFPCPNSISLGDLGSLVVSLPWTKVKKWEGEQIFLSVQDEPVNPVSSLRQHLKRNSVAPTSLLFSFRDDYGTSVLVKSQFLKHCNDIWASCGLTQTTGHSFRIGGTSHLLLCGVDPDIIKKSGQWSSNSFLRYWRNLETVIPKKTTRVSTQRASGRLGEPCPIPGCGLSPSGLATPDVDSPSTAPPKDGAVVVPI